ncbi:hypothetical protein P4234_00085 [Pseudomonas aeruginosa]|nr:hypothetical protein [Pseudomonas aeruginosa]
MDDYERGTMKLGDFVSAAKGARNGLSLLNDSDMRQLESAIEAANQKIQQLKEGSEVDAGQPARGTGGAARRAGGRGSQPVQQPQG